MTSRFALSKRELNNKNIYGMESKLSYLAHVLAEDCKGLIAAGTSARASDNQLIAGDAWLLPRRKRENAIHEFSFERRLVREDCIKYALKFNSGAVW